MQDVRDGAARCSARFRIGLGYVADPNEHLRFSTVPGDCAHHFAAGGNLARRAVYAPYLFEEVEFVAPCYPYRRKRDGETDEEYGLRAAGELEEAIVRTGPDRVAAFVAEPVVGATAGCLVPATGYFARVREICDRYEVLFVADEIMCGVGRTGTLFALEQEGVSPDILTVAKGLGAGYQPVGAVLASAEVVGALRSRVNLTS